jgi:hypothetical protein
MGLIEGSKCLLSIPTLGKSGYLFPLNDAIRELRV